MRTSQGGGSQENISFSPPSVLPAFLQCNNSISLLEAEEAINLSVLPLTNVFCHKINEFSHPESLKIMVRLSSNALCFETQ